jgi:hypothetical protein
MSAAVFGLLAVRAVTKIRRTCSLLRFRNMNREGARLKGGLTVEGAAAILQLGRCCASSVLQTGTSQWFVSRLSFQSLHGVLLSWRLPILSADPLDLRPRHFRLRISEFQHGPQPSQLKRAQAFNLPKKIEHELERFRRRVCRHLILPSRSPARLVQVLGLDFVQLK